METITREQAAGKLGLCLLCGTPGTDKNPTRRGRCNKHYAHYLDLRDKIPVEYRHAFERDLEENGLLLPDRYKPEVTDETDEIAKKYLAMPKQTSRDKKAIEQGLAASAKMLKDKNKGDRK